MRRAWRPALPQRVEHAREREMACGRFASIPSARSAAAIAEARTAAGPANRARVSPPAVEYASAKAACALANAGSMRAARSRYAMLSSSDSLFFCSNSFVPRT
jgi:hypothetical protein